MALAMPDICASLEDGSTTGVRYKNWFDRYLKPTYCPDPMTTREQLIQHRIKIWGIGKNAVVVIANIRETVFSYTDDHFNAEINVINNGSSPTAFSANDCWIFRCKSLHQGISERSNSVAMQFSPPDQSMISVHKCIFNGVYTIDIRIFCEDVCKAVEQWLSDKAGDIIIQQRIGELMNLNNPIPGIHNNFQIGI